MVQDPYKILGVSPDASDEEIKKAYRELTKRYHPDLNPGDEHAAQMMNDINTAYDQIKNGGAQQYNPYGQGSQYQQYQQYGNWTGWNGWGGWANSYQNSERSEYTAAKNYIRNRMYREALNALSGVPERERDGKWYYLSAGANMYLGNKVTALEHAKRAVEIDPDNEMYHHLLEHLQSGKDYYETYTTRYSNSINLNPLWLGLCAANILCPGYICYCPGRMC